MTVSDKNSNLPRNPWNLSRSYTPTEEGSTAPMYDNIQKKDAIGLLTAELNALSVEERDKLYDEIHGVASIIEETPSFVREKLRAMREELTRVKERNALDRAIFLRPSLEVDDKLHLMFLRARGFDVIQAANLMCLHFQIKLELFGDDLLVRRVTIDDLNEKELEMIKAGSFQFLKSRDSRGRVIAFWNVATLQWEDPKALMRYQWYIISSAVEENVDLQKRGVVLVGFLYGDFKFSAAQMLDTFRRISRLPKNRPYHLNGVHICYDNRALELLFNGTAMITGKSYRIRQRYHFGSITETQYKLLTFGLNMEGCFVPGKGVLSPDACTKFIHERRQLDSLWRQIMEKPYENPSSTFALYPNKQDVLLGRGRISREWPGNVYFSRLVEQYAPRYIQAKSRFEKTVISMELKNRMEKDLGGRFLKRLEDSSGWEVVDDGASKEKVNQALRDSTSRLKRARG